MIACALASRRLRTFERLGGGAVGHHGQGVGGDSAVASGVGVGPAPKKWPTGWKAVGRARLVKYPIAVAEETVAAL